METDAIGKEVRTAAAIRPAPQHWRIKLYELEEQGAWIDKGTGFVHVKVVSELGGPALVIRSEENDGVIFFQSKVQTDDVYEIQGDNIIMWRETDANGGLGLDYALSFQESAGCTAIWDQIVKYQAQCLAQREHTFTRPEGAPGSLTDRGFGIGPILSILDLSRSPTNSSRSNSVSNSIGYTGNSAILVLPTDCEEESSLARIRYKLETLYPAQREFAISQLLDHDGAYINKLLNIFGKLEAKNDVNSLRILAEIFRAILLLNDPALLEHLIATDEVFYRLSGVMEYDRTLQEQGNYREFLFRTARYREVVPLESAFDPVTQVTDMRTGCTVLYRLRFVRDIMLHPKIDDPGITAIGSMISFSSSEICTMMLQNTAYVARVLKVIWPALHIDDYIPTGGTKDSALLSQEQASVAPSSATVSPDLSPLHTEGSMDIVGNTSVYTSTSASTASKGGAEDSITAEDTIRSDSTDTIEDEDFIGPTPSLSAACTTETVVTPPGSALNSAQCSTVPSSAVINAASRPIDGLRFLRELFAMSKFLTVEKRVELFHQLFEGLHQPLMLVINRVLVECRGGDSVTYGIGSASASNKPSSTVSAGVNATVGAMVVEDDAPVNTNINTSANTNTCASASTDALFLPEEQAVATQVIGEVLTALGLVCPSLLRQVVITSPVPAVNPLSNASKSANVSASKLTFPWWEHCTLFLCIDVIVNSPDSASIQSFGDVVKLVLDLEKAPSAQVKNDNYKFLSYFYDHYLVWLLVPYLEHLDPSLPVPASYYSQLKVTPHKSCAVVDTSSIGAGASGAVDSAGANYGTGSSGSDSVQYVDNQYSQCGSAVHASRRNLMEIVIQCVTTHSYRFKYYAMRNGVLSKILTKSFQQRDSAITTTTTTTHTATGDSANSATTYASSSNKWSWLHMLGIKFTKAVISVKDEFYYKHIEKLDLFRHMLTMYKDIAHKDNMVTASLLDVVEDIRMLNIKNLVVYVVSKYSSCFVSGNKVFERLRIKYDQIVDRSYAEDTTGTGAAANSILHTAGSKTKQQRKYRDFDTEEDYFFGDDDSSVPSAPESEYSVDSHKDKRMRTDSGVSVGDNVLSSIVMGAFSGSGANGNTSPNTNTLGSLANSNGTGNSGSRALSRTSSLGRDGVHNGVLSSSGNNSVNSSYISSNNASTHSTNLGPLSNISSNTSTHTNLSSNYSISSASGNTSLNSNTSNSTTAGVRHSIMAMLGGYGDGDATEMEDGGEGLRPPEEPTQSAEFAAVYNAFSGGGSVSTNSGAGASNATGGTSGSIYSGGVHPLMNMPTLQFLNTSPIPGFGSLAGAGGSPKSLAHKMNAYYLNNSADLNIYEDEDLVAQRAERSNSADLSDCASSISSDDDTAEREEAVRRMAAIHTAGARYCDGFSIPAPVFDIYAGSDFVRSNNDVAMSDSGSGNGDGAHGDVSGLQQYLSQHQPLLHAHHHQHQQLQQDTTPSANTTAEPVDPLADSLTLPLPPLKPRFEYDHDEEHTFIHNNTTSHSSNGTPANSSTSSGNSTTSTSTSGGNGGGGGISFSFKKKPKI